MEIKTSYEYFKVILDIEEIQLLFYKIENIIQLITWKQLSVNVNTMNWGICKSAPHWCCIF